MTTPKLQLEELANSAGNYLRANTTFGALDQLVQARVLDKDLTTPPGSPANGAAYIVASGNWGTGSSKAGQIAYWLTAVGAWQFLVPALGWRVSVADELDANGVAVIYGYTGSAWSLPESSGGAFTGGTLTAAINEAPITTLTSAATTAIGAQDVNTISISGTTTITAFDTIASGAKRLLVFSGVLTLTHNATSLILPTGANIATAAGDVAEFVSHGSGNWRCTGYLRADGSALSSGGGGMTNPMTTAGDLIVGGASGTPTRLGIGTDTHVLTMTSGVPGWAAPGGGGGLTNFTDAKNTAAPNATVPAVSLSVTITESIGDAVLRAKGDGATLAQIPDNSTIGGDKRGQRATDWQKSRNASGQVAQGNSSTISGGANNHALGFGSTIGGGVGNSTSGSQAAIAGGVGGVVSAINGFIGGGSNNTINSGADTGVILGGMNNLVLTNSTAAGVLGGSGNTASGPYSSVLGGYQAVSRGIYGAEVRASGQFSTQGDAQRGRYIKRRSTTTATPATIGTDGSAGGATNQVILPNNSAYNFSGRVVARENATGDCGAWEFKGLIRRGANAAATALVAAVTPSVIAADAGAAAWVVAVTADTSNGGIAITVTGEASHTIRWVADIETVEVVG